MESIQFYLLTIIITSLLIVSLVSYYINERTAILENMVKRAQENIQAQVQQSRSLTGPTGPTMQFPSTQFQQLTSCPAGQYLYGNVCLDCLGGTVSGNSCMCPTGMSLHSNVACCAPGGPCTY